MNQDNNFSQNDFNSQGNNGIPNNQPLNNQSYNQGMSVNQQPINPQPQSTSSYQQPTNQMNMQQPAPQPMNSFESADASNTNINSKPPKKMNIGLIVGIVAAVAVVGVGVAFGSKLLSNGGKNDNINAVNNIKNGTAKLVYTTKNKIHQIDNINAYNYFYTYEPYGPATVLDNKGNELFTATRYTYLGDTYFLVSIDENNNRDYVKIYDANKKKYVFQFANKGAYSYVYKNGILYYDDNSDMTTAYDLINQKQLWSVNANGNIMEVTNEYIFFDSNNYSSRPDIIYRDLYPSIVLDLDGNVVIEGNTDEYENYNFEKNDLVHTFVMNDNYYLKVKFKKYIEVYDFNHKLISNISLEPSETTTYYLDKIFDEGLFTVWESNKSDLGKYVLYDVNKNIVLESDSNIDYASNVNGSIISSDVLALESAGKYYLIKDGKIVEKFDDYHNEDSALVVTPLSGDENSYLLIENNDTVNSIYTKQFINLETLEKFDVPLENLSEHLDEAPNGEYIILSTGNDFYVYDSKFNLKYQSTNQLDPINDKYVFEYTSDDNKMYVVNIENGKKNEIDTKGEFKSELSSGGFVTSDGTNYYLYGFN